MGNEGFQRHARNVELMTVRGDVVVAVVEVCGLSAEGLTDDATLEVLEIDSLDLIEVGMIMEEKHGIRITTDDFVDVTTFGEAVAVFDQIVAAGAGG